MTPKPPWSARQSRKDIEKFYVLREGVPDGLKQSLMAELDAYFCDGRGTIKERTLHLGRKVDRILPYARKELLDLFAADDILLLDAVDHALAHPPRVFSHPVLSVRVRAYLSDVRSAYDVVHVGGDEHELCDRQPPTITELVEQATSDGSRAAEHLRRAWSLGFSREADLNAACVEAIKAIEAAAKPVVQPNHAKATLGTMLGEIRNTPAKWRTDLDAPDSKRLETVIAMMTMVWEGHLRHGNPDEPLDVSKEQCEMIVHTAALLVHWFVSGRVARV